MVDTTVKRRLLGSGAGVAGALPVGLTLAALAMLIACSSQTGAPERSATGSPRFNRPMQGPGEEEMVIASAPVCASDNPFCSPTQTSTDAPAVAATPGTAEPTAPGGPTNCGSLPIDLAPAGVNIMVAVDAATAMEPHWENVATAIRSLRAANPTASFGLHVFWADAIDIWNFEDVAGSLNTTNNACTEVHSDVLELGDHSADELIGFLGDGPRGGTIQDRYQVSPVIQPLNRYLTRLTTLVDPNRTNYLLVFTGGNDNCFGSAFASQQDKLLAYQKLAYELSRFNVRVIPVGIDPPSGPPPDPGLFSWRTGLEGVDIDSITTDYEALGALLEGGQSGLDEVPRVDTQEELEELVAKVGQAVVNCRFQIPDEFDASKSASAFELSFSINGRNVPRDRARTNGWDFVSGKGNQIEFYGQSCEAIQTGLSVEAGKTCETDICGQAAVSVSTKPRAVLLLLDASASRIECSDGTLGCVLSAPGTPGRPQSYWEVVQQAVSQALAEPVNADIEFGMQFFPGKTEGALSCAVTEEPELMPTPRNQIDVMRAMLEKLPFGLSPVVDVMERVVANPGRLADEDVIGSVVMLSDGGENCSGENQEGIVSRLGDAASKLLEMDIKTYAVRYGSEAGRTPDLEAQLTALVENGGTASMVGDTPYINANSAEELVSALGEISDRLANCSFALGQLKPGVDKNRTSLFMDGEKIEFNAMGMEHNGWSWVDAKRTTIELNGEACESFKTSRRTNIVVEFGCEPIETPPPPDPPPLL